MRDMRVRRRIFGRRVMPEGGWGKGMTGKGIWGKGMTGEPLAPA